MYKIIYFDEAEEKVRTARKEFRTKANAEKYLKSRSLLSNWGKIVTKEEYNKHKYNLNEIV